MSTWKIQLFITRAVTKNLEKVTNRLDQNRQNRTSIFDTTFVIFQAVTDMHTHTLDGSKNTVNKIWRKSNWTNRNQFNGNSLCSRWRNCIKGHTFDEIIIRFINWIKAISWVKAKQAELENISFNIQTFKYSKWS